jgi:hypothetical protein
VHLFYGPISSTTVSAADSTFAGESVGDCAGFTLSVGDGNGDGRQDVWISARYSDLGGTDSGAVYYKEGPFAAGTISLSSATARLYGEGSRDLAGFMVNSGDFNGDGLADMHTGALEVDVNGTRSGAAYVVLSPMSGTQSLSAADLIFYGEAAGDLFGGTYLGKPGDMDGDGDEELLVPAYTGDRGASNAGQLYLFLGG